MFFLLNNVESKAAMEELRLKMVANGSIQLYKRDKQFLLECRKPKKGKQESSRKRKSSKALEDLVVTSNPASPVSLSSTNSPLPESSILTRTPSPT